MERRWKGVWVGGMQYLRVRHNRPAPHPSNWLGLCFACLRLVMRNAER